MLAEHKQPDHHYERISDIIEKQREDFQVLITECRSKVSVCDEASSTLENSLSELQMQRDNAKGLVQETFQTYKTILEKQKVRVYLIWSFISNIKTYKSYHNFIVRSVR